MKRLILWIISPYLVDKFNATVPYRTLQYGTIRTCGIWHLAMRFVLAAGPSRTVFVAQQSSRYLFRPQAPPITVGFYHNDTVSYRTLLSCSRYLADQIRTTSSNKRAILTGKKGYSHPESVSHSIFNRWKSNWDSACATSTSDSSSPRSLELP